jgi:hypothetical protein
MTEAENTVREVLRDIADEGRPVYLAGRALTGVARRRRRHRLMTGVAVILLAGGTAAAVQVAAPRPSGTPVPIGSSTTVAASTRTSGMLVFAYTVEGRRPSVLNPATGRHREVADVAGVLAVAPDLRSAIVFREHTPIMPDGTRLQAVQPGLLDTSTGQVMRWFDLPDHLGVVAWSPDGRQVVFSLRTAVSGQGWTVDRLAFLDPATGALRYQAIVGGGNRQPQQLLGWTSDSRAVVVAADRAGTDSVPDAHLVYDIHGTLIAVRPWTAQYASVRLVPRTGHLVLEPFTEPMICPVIDPGSGSTLDRVLCAHLAAARPDELVWYDDRHVPVLDGTDLALLDVTTGHRTSVQTLPEPARHVTLAAATNITGPAASLLF